MCFTINKEETVKLQKKKVPIKGFKFVVKRKDGALVSERTAKFVYPKKGTVEVKKPMAVSGNDNVPYDSKASTLHAKTGIYFFLGQPKPDHFNDDAFYILLLSVDPADLLGTNGNVAVAKKVTVLKSKAFTLPNMMDVEDELERTCERDKAVLDKLYDKKISAAWDKHNADLKKFIASLK